MRGHLDAAASEQVCQNRPRFHVSRYRRTAENADRLEELARCKETMQYHFVAYWVYGSGP
jgi:hypothetical protein